MNISYILVAAPIIVGAVIYFDAFFISHADYTQNLLSEAFGVSIELFAIYGILNVHDRARTRARRNLLSQRILGRTLKLADEQFIDIKNSVINYSLHYGMFVDYMTRHGETIHDTPNPTRISSSPEFSTLQRNYLDARSHLLKIDDFFDIALMYNEELNNHTAELVHAFSEKLDIFKNLLCNKILTNAVSIEAISSDIDEMSNFKSSENDRKDEAEKACKDLADILRDMSKSIDFKFESASEYESLSEYWTFQSSNSK